MNKTYILIIASVIIIAVPISNAYALEILDRLTSLNNPFPFEVTMNVTKLDKTPTKKGDGSYYLVYGKIKEDGKIKDKIIEIQTNTFSVIGNAGNLEQINRDLVYNKVESMIGMTVTFECNGFNNVQFVEEYPQCFKVKSSKGVPLKQQNSCPDIKALQNEIKQLKADIKKKDDMIATLTINLVKLTDKIK